MSSRQLNSPETSVLQKGLNFAVVPEKPPINEVIQATELACKQLENDTAAELRARVANVLKTTRLPPSNRQISLYVHRRIRVDVGHVFGVKTNPYLKIKYTFEIFHQPAVKL